MKHSLKDLLRLWKFYFWPLVWGLAFAPAFFFTMSLTGIALFVSRVLGVILLLAALFLTSVGGRTLAKFAHQPAHEHFWPDQFTEFGVFGCMRHAMHLGLALFPLSLALLSGRILALAGAGWGVAAALWFILVIEEKEALAKYGQVYADYMQRVPPFSLRPSCWRQALAIWRK